MTVEVARGVSVPTVPVRGVRYTFLCDYSSRRGVRDADRGLSDEDLYSMDVLDHLTRVKVRVRDELKMIKRKRGPVERLLFEVL